MIERDFPGTGKNIAIIGVPIGFGAGQTGSELGIAAIRLSPIRGKRLIEHIADLGYAVEDRGDVEVDRPTRTAEPGENPRYLAEWLASSRKSSDAVRGILAENKFPVILSGDHSCAAGTFAGISAHFRANSQEVGLIWFDAHGDMNTPETSPSGNVHGMPLAALLGAGNSEIINLQGFAPKVNPRFCAHIGARDLDAGEKRLIRELGMERNFFTMSDIDRRGMLACVEDAVKIVSGASGGYAVTFDVDILDPRFAPGSGTLVRGGITYREAHLALEVIHEMGGMRAFEIVEVNPLLDSSNITVELGSELILSALGKTIL